MDETFHNLKAVAATLTREELEDVAVSATLMLALGPAGAALCLSEEDGLRVAQSARKFLAALKPCTGKS